MLIVGVALAIVAGLGFEVGVGAVAAAMTIGVAGVGMILDAVGDDHLKKEVQQDVKEFESALSWLEGK